MNPRRYMLDTDTCSYIIRGESVSLQRHVFAHQNQLCVSAVTLAELLFGAAKKQSPRLSKAIHFFRELVDVIQWDENAASAYADIRNELETKGTPVGNMDMMIAASAQAGGFCLVSNNTAHFSRIAGLQLENWY